jgi:hypothetical protein
MIHLKMNDCIFINRILCSLLPTCYGKDYILLSLSSNCSVIMTYNPIVCLKSEKKRRRRKFM